MEADIAKLREENATLRRQADELSSASAALKKAEARAETLEEKVRFVLGQVLYAAMLTILSQMETLIQERVAQKENELNATYDEKLLNYEER